MVLNGMVRRYILVVRCKSPSFVAAFHGGTPLSVCSTATAIL